MLFADFPSLSQKNNRISGRFNVSLLWMLQFSDSMLLATQEQKLNRVGEWALQRTFKQEIMEKPRGFNDKDCKRF